jgi:hypothetical protein
MVIRGRLVLVGTILVVGGLASGCRYGFNAQNNQATDDASLSQTVGEVRLASGPGDVSIQVGSTASVHRIVHYNGDNKPGSSTTFSGGVLTLNGCGDNCSVDYMVTLPANAKIDGSTDSGDITVSGATSVSVHSDSGSITVSGVTGAVDVSSASGEIKAAGSGGDVQAHADSGDVTVNGVGGTATLQTNSGRIVANGLKGIKTTAHDSSGDITISPDVPQNLELRDSSGNIVVTVPGGTYRVNATTESGDTKVGVGNDANAELTITAQASSGDVRISAK